MPELIERIGDVPLLVGHFVPRLAREMNRQVLGVDDRAMQVLQRYHWPGNVRELENVIKRALVLCKGPYVGVDDLPPKVIRSAAEAARSEQPQPQTLKQALEEPEKRVIEDALRANGWNRQLTSEQLGINRTTLYKKMKRYRLDAEPLPTYS